MCLCGTRALDSHLPCFKAASSPLTLDVWCRYTPAHLQSLGRILQCGSACAMRSKCSNRAVLAGVILFSYYYRVVLLGQDVRVFRPHAYCAHCVGGSCDACEYDLLLSRCTACCRVPGQCTHTCWYALLPPSTLLHTHFPPFLAACFAAKLAPAAVATAC